jgi:hypothetical protein
MNSNAFEQIIFGNLYKSSINLRNNAESNATLKNNIFDKFQLYYAYSELMILHTPSGKFVSLDVYINNVK